MQDIVNIKAEHAHIYVKRAMIHNIHTHNGCLHTHNISLPEELIILVRSREPGDKDGRKSFQCILSTLFDSEPCTPIQNIKI